MDLDEDSYVRSIWMWDGDTKPFTTGRGDTSPWWSPDGTKLAFLRKGPGKDDPPQVAVMPADGGEAQIVSEFSLGVREIEWSPDGAHLIVLATTWTEEWAGLDDDERSRKPRRINAFRYRFDSRGWIHDRRDDVYVVDASGGGAARRVGSGEASQAGHAVSPDGSRVAYVTSLDDPRRMKTGDELVETDLDTGAEAVRVMGSGFMRTAYGQDGSLYGVGSPDPAYPALTSLWRLDDQPTDLTGHTDRSIFSFLQPLDMATPHWLDDGFLIGQVDGGRIRLVHFDGEGKVTNVIGGDRYITGYARAEDGTIFFAASDATNPGELYALESDGSERRLTGFNDTFRDSAALVEPVSYRVETAADIEVDTWLFVPDGDGPFPVLLNIHGGPASQYGFNFFDEFQVFAGAGYAVVACNPRGSAGRGHDWLRAVTGDGWGVVDLEDITAVVDNALARDSRLDGRRLGIMGGSYGGFLTAWTIGRDHRYRSAVVERALVGWESFGGTSDIARDFSRFYLGLTPPCGHVGLREASPLDRAADIQTPTLIIHSEDDLRCPIEQAEQLFMTLLRNDVDVEMIRFPAESHELSRSGTPRHRLERFEYILEWHDAHLGVG